MSIIMGLGNPGLKYKSTRHNIGSRVIEILAERNGIRFLRNLRYRFKSGKGTICDKEVILGVPLRYMNESGLSVAQLFKARKLALSRLLIVLDCIDLPFKSMRLKEKGADAGHKGMRSVIKELNSSQISRLKIGVGRPPGDKQVSEYVLESFSYQEEKELPEVIDSAIKIIEEWLKVKECKE